MERGGEEIRVSSHRKREEREGTERIERLRGQSLSVVQLRLASLSHTFLTLILNCCQHRLRSLSHSHTLSLHFQMGVSMEDVFGLLDPREGPSLHTRIHTHNTCTHPKTISFTKSLGNPLNTPILERPYSGFASDSFALRTISDFVRYFHSKFFQDSLQRLNILRNSSKPKGKERKGEGDRVREGGGEREREGEREGDGEVEGEEDWARAWAMGGSHRFSVYEKDRKVLFDFAEKLYTRRQEETHRISQSLFVVLREYLISLSRERARGEREREREEGKGEERGEREREEEGRESERRGVREDEREKGGGGEREREGGGERRDITEVFSTFLTSSGILTSEDSHYFMASLDEEGRRREEEEMWREREEEERKREREGEREGRKEREPSDEEGRRREEERELELDEIGWKEWEREREENARLREEWERERERDLQKWDSFTRTMNDDWMDEEEGGRRVRVRKKEMEKRRRGDGRRKRMNEKERNAESDSEYLTHSHTHTPTHALSHSHTPTHIHNLTHTPLSLSIGRRKRRGRGRKERREERGEEREEEEEEEDEEKNDKKERRGSVRAESLLSPLWILDVDVDRVFRPIVMSILSLLLPMERAKCLYYGHGRDWCAFALIAHPFHFRLNLSF